jgi:hypothetical protein
MKDGMSVRGLRIPHQALSPLLAGGRPTRLVPVRAGSPLGSLLGAAFDAAAAQVPLLSPELGDAPTEILPSVGAISKYSARRCRPRRHISRAHPREPWGSRPTKATSPRETDSPPEQKGFEPLVPPTRSFLRSATVILGRRYRPSFEPSQGWRSRAGCELTHDGAV